MFKKIKSLWNRLIRAQPYETTADLIREPPPKEEKNDFSGVTFNEPVTSEQFFEKSEDLDDFIKKITNKNE